MKESRWFPTVTAIFVTSLIISNIIAVKIISIGGLVLTAGIVIFPISYIFGDILTEVYGYARARQVIWTGFACNLLAVLAIVAGGLLPASSDWGLQESYNAILGFAPRLLIASFIAFLIGEFLNSYVMAKMKIASDGKRLWQRTIGSTVVAQFADTILFTVIAFAGILPTPVLINIIITEWILKTAYEALATPATYAIVNYLKRVEGIDHYDKDTDFNPVALKS